MKTIQENKYLLTCKKCNKLFNTIKIDVYCKECFKKTETNLNAVFFFVNLEPIEIILASLCCRDNLVDLTL